MFIRSCSLQLGFSIKTTNTTTTTTSTTNTTTTTTTSTTNDNNNNKSNNISKNTTQHKRSQVKTVNASSYVYVSVCVFSNSLPKKIYKFFMHKFMAFLKQNM
ncbi:hypothetical protein E2C01_084812 [Portunus trituberculatus]|uniref:Uncharacterized protein n=1 Tax=Portunus trituberculatus TaxID=210409 RepID=A0A5B7IZ97_PORTR|nr:hypothetical protein [Portunus trituberculatus]